MNSLKKVKVREKMILENIKRDKFEGEHIGIGSHFTHRWPVIIGLNQLKL